MYYVTATYLLHKATEMLSKQYVIIAWEYVET